MAQVNVGKGKAVERAKDPKAAWKFLWTYLGKFKIPIFFALVLNLVSSSLALVGPKLSGKAIDAISGEKGVDFDTVFYYCVLMVGFYLLSALLAYALAMLMRTISQRIVKQMRRDVFNRLMDLPVGYFDRNQAGDIISRVSYDIDVINTSLSSDVVQILASMVTVVGSFIMMVQISPILVLVMCITIPASFIFTKKMTKISRPKFSERSRRLGAMNGYVEETVGGQKVIQAYAAEPVFTERFAAVNKAANDAYYAADCMNATIGPSVNMINNLSLVLVTVFGALLYFNSLVTIGNVSSFVLYSRKFSGPINEAANIIGELQSALAAAERVSKVLNEEMETADRESAIDLKAEGKVDIEAVDFGYEAEKLILKDFNLHAGKGKTIAIVGPTGAGKTTVINLLMRFYDPNSGTIKVDDTDNLDITRKSLRLNYAMVLQDTWVFGGTIFENIAYGKEDATMEEVVEAAKAARIHNFITRLPEGYDTILTEDGVNISKGQKQLLTIARAMLLDAKMLILDEATSNVDTRTEKKIQRAMEKLMEGKTCFIIAHRLSTIENADDIIVVKDGRIVENGTHATLMERKGAYYELYSSQIK